MKTRFAVLPFLLTLAACSAGNDRYVLEAPPPSPPYDDSVPTASRPDTPPAPRTAGPLSLAGIGSYMDAQETDLRSRLRGTGAVVTRPGDDLVIVLRNDLFLSGMQVTASGGELLSAIAEVLRHYDHSSIQIQGFTDTTGTPERNLALSDARAKIVLDTLRRDGVPSRRISSQGFGETRLRVSTGDNVNEPRNRRVEIRIIARPG